MKKYKYVAVNLQKKKFTGSFLAEDEKDLSRQLALQNLYLVSCKIDREKSPSAFFSVSGKVKVQELATFCRQFAIMINTGTPVVDSLNILKDQSYTAYFRKLLSIVHEDVQSGLILSQALKKHSKVFPDFFYNMVYVGEMSGRLEKVLVSIADYFETDSKIRKKAKGAMTYPLILIVMALGIVVLMMVFIIPTFKDALSSLEVNMPPLTLAIYEMSDYVTKNWVKIALVALAVVLVCYLFVHNKKGRLIWDRFKLEAPVIGKVTTNLVTARFARAFGLLLESGMDVVDAMEVVRVVLGNAYVCQKFSKATEDVRNGMSLTVALTNYKLFPQILVQMISVGEKTGNIADVLTRSCGYYDNEVESTLNAMTTIIQPIVLIFIGAVVGVLFYAVYSPLLEVMNKLG